MKEIQASAITACVREMIAHACVHASCDVIRALEKAHASETGCHAKYALSQLLDNVRVAQEENTALCQDTGMAVFFVELGQDVHIQGNFYDAINEGVRLAYREGHFRMSVLDPLSRENTKDNTPAVVHVELVPGNVLKLTFLAKGFGSENMSKLYMLTPSKGTEGVIDCIVETVRLAGANPCPPIVVGVGIGGTMEMAAISAKRALLREVGTPSSDADVAAIEREALSRINALGIGAQGFGGDTTALAVHAIKTPTHIAGLPVAINVQCHAVRHETRTL